MLKNLRLKFIVFNGENKWFPNIYLACYLVNRIYFTSTKYLSLIWRIF